MTNRDPVACTVEDALPDHAVDRRLERKCPEQRRPKMRVPCQDRPLFQAEQLVLGRLGERAIGGIGQLFIADTAVKRRTAVAENLTVDLRAELLSAEENH